MRKFVRIAALMLAAVVLAVPSMALAQVQYLELTASDDAYSERATIEVPAGGFPENTVEEGVNPITGRGLHRRVSADPHDHPTCIPTRSPTGASPPRT